MKKDEIYLLIDMNSGAMDGFYALLPMAQAVLAYHKQRGGMWIVTKIMDAPDNLELPNHLFWLNRDPQAEAEYP